MEKKLYRDEHNKMIAGVCAGLADYLSIDVTLVRIIFVLTLVLHGCGLIPYIILWIVMPKRTYGFNAGPVDYTVPPRPDNPVDYSVPNPFGGFTPPKQGAPFVTPPKKRSNAGVIVGAALVLFGSFFLLDNFNLLPDWEFDHLWPLIFVAAGLVLVFSPKKQNPWEKDNWGTTGEPSASVKEEPSAPTKEDKDKAEDTPPTI